MTRSCCSRVAIGGTPLPTCSAATGSDWPPASRASCSPAPLARTRSIAVMEDTELNGRGVRVRIYFGERDKQHGKPLWSALLEELRRSGAAGATVLRGLAGY